MKFVSPAWLWALCLFPLLYVWMMWEDRKRENLFEKFADRSLWDLIAPERDPRARPKKGRLFLAGLMFLFLALARPQWGSHEESVQVSGLDLVIALDLSSSMEAEDVAPSRLMKAKHAIRTLVNRLDGDRVGLVGFAGSSYVAVPLTTDLSYLLDSVQILNPHLIQTQGTDLGLGLETSLKALDRGAEEVASPSQSSQGKEKEHPSRGLILVTDGEDHEGQALETAKKIAKAGTRLYILGVGTEKGGPVPVRDESGGVQGYKRDSSGRPVVSQFQDAGLTSLARAASGKYWNISQDESAIEEILQDLGALNRTDYAERRYLVYEDRFQIPLFIAIVFFLIELSVSVRRLPALLLVFVLGGARLAQAGPLAKQVPIETYLENRKGLEAFRAGKLEEAQKEFGSAQARDPSRPELEFNQGVVQLQQGDTDRAIESFSHSANQSEANQNYDLLGKSHYNLGNAFSKKGDTKSAVQSYLNAIRAAEMSKDKQLEDSARKNLQLLVHEMKKQKEQQKQDDKNQKNSDQKQQQQQQQQEQKNSKENQQNQGNQEKQDQEKNQSVKETSQKEKKRQFQSKKMSQEDADRVMSELKNRERQLQEKIQTQHGHTKSNPKDW